jgi:hypothetical protein
MKKALEKIGLAYIWQNQHNINNQLIIVINKRRKDVEK